jgi:hypothetical protein
LSLKEYSINECDGRHGILVFTFKYRKSKLAHSFGKPLGKVDEFLELGILSCGYSKGDIVEGGHFCYCSGERRHYPKTLETDSYIQILTA